MTLLLVLLLLAAFAIAALVLIMIALMKAPRATLQVGMGVAVTLVLGWTLLLRAHHLGHVPRALEVWRVIYANEESWGFGPGGNEAGFIAYALPDDIATQIAREGIEYLTRMPTDGSGHDWRGRFSDWQPTPIRPSQRWTPSTESSRYEILQYVCAYGFCIDIDRRQLEDATTAVNSPGNYYAYGRIGVIVVAPGMRRVYFLYNG